MVLGEGPWVERSRRSVSVLVVDLLLIAIVISWGLHVHAIDPTQYPDHAMRTIGPFLVGWLVGGPAAGAYRSSSLERGTWALPTVLCGWIVAVLIGGVVRASALVPGSAPWIFLAVMIGFGAVALVPWRGLVCLATRA